MNQMQVGFNTGGYYFSTWKCIFLTGFSSLRMVGREQWACMALFCPFSEGHRTTFFPGCQCGTLERVPNSLKINKSVWDQLSHANQVASECEDKCCGTQPMNLCSAGRQWHSYPPPPLRPDSWHSACTHPWINTSVCFMTMLAQPNVTAQPILPLNKTQHCLETRTCFHCLVVEVQP